MFQTFIENQAVSRAQIPIIQIMVGKGAHQIVTFFQKRGNLGGFGGILGKFHPSVQQKEGSIRLLFHIRLPMAFIHYVNHKIKAVLFMVIKGIL